MAVIAGDVAGTSGMLRRVLGDVRRRIRAYVVVEGIGLTIAVAGLGLWLALGLDRLFEPSRPVRLAMLALALSAAGAVFYRKVISRLLVPLGDRSLALVVERSFRTLDESLLTAIELDSHELPEMGRNLLAASRDRAASTLQGTNLDGIFDPLPRRLAVAAALASAATIGLFAILAPGLFLLGLQRLTAQTDELWPRRTGLTVVGFENGERVVAVGSDVELIVRADTRKEIPSRVDVYFRSEKGDRDQEIMDMVGKAGADEPFQPYKFTFKGVASTLMLDIYGGDARLRNLKLRVVERPRAALRLACVFPGYTRREPASLDVTGTMLLPQGTLVKVDAECQKPLRRATISRPDGRGGTTIEVVELDPEKREKKFAVDLGALMFDSQVTFDLLDLDGIENRSTLLIQSVPDVPPSVNVARKAIETSVTPQARVPLVGKITDDYGLARLWFEYSVDGSPAREALFVVQPVGSRESVIDEALDLPTLYPSPQPLVPGQQLSIIPKAIDARELPGEPKGNLAAGEPTVLTVVTDAEMLRLLEAREIMLREQFKQLITKVTRDRDSLVSVGEKKENPVRDEAADDGGDAAEETGIPRDRIVVDQARSHTKENGTETLVVADGFTLIVEELTNNRIAEGVQLQERLAGEVAAPLRRIGVDMFPEYEARLTELHLAVGKQNDPEGVKAAQRAAIRSADSILVEMNVVLNKMLELESFKEAVDLLRSIIALNKDIGEQVEKRSNSADRLRGLKLAPKKD
jgi:hypothetical protein